MKNLVLMGLMLITLSATAQTTKNDKQMNTTALEVFQAFGEGMMSGTDAWKDVIANDIQFIGPVDQVSGKEAFIALNESFMPAIRGNTLKQMVTHENWVITQIDIQVEMASGKTITLDMTEWYEIKEGLIQSIKVYYDAEEFRKENGMQSAK